jgi:hypothetical protein
VTYRREYENFTHLPGESIDAMFQWFTMIVNNMRANVVVLSYDDHERAIKLLHSLDRTMWSEKVEAILELEKYEILTVDKLFSKLKSSEVDRGVRAKIETETEHPLAPTRAPPMYLDLDFGCGDLQFACSVALASQRWEDGSVATLGTPLASAAACGRV